MMYQRILVGTDGSAQSRRAGDHAARIAVAIGAHLTVAAVAVEHGEPTSAWSEGATERPIPMAVADKRASEEAERLAAQTGLEVTFLVLEGGAAETLAKEAASGGYDLLVIGERGQGSGPIPRPGSVCESLAHLVPCPLLIVP